MKEEEKEKKHQEVKSKKVTHMQIEGKYRQIVCGNAKWGVELEREKTPLWIRFLNPKYTNIDPFPLL
jgi:hypothetical protein